MQFLRSVLGSGPAKDALPYELGEAYPTCWGSWTHYRGTSKEDGSEVSVFAITGVNAQDAKLAPARNSAKRLRTLRHPNVISFLNSVEIEKEEGGVVKPTLYIITEPVAPLPDKLKELNLRGTQRDEYYSWGLLQIAKAVSFLNNDCKLVHGNVCTSSVVVTKTLDWKLHFFDVLAEFDGGRPEGPAPGPMLPYEWLVGTQYKPMEVTKGDWDSVRRGPPHAIDAWGLGCFMQELFSGQKLMRTEELRNTSSIPKTVLPDYQRLLGSQPARRMNPSKLVDNSEFFQNRLVDTFQFLEVLSLKDSVEKDTFFRKLPTAAEQLPRPIALKKLLPALASALEFGSAPAPALTCLLKMGSWMPTDEFNQKVLPTLVKLFASPDRAVRVALLQHIDSFGTAINPTQIEDQVFTHVAAGFADNSAFLRELTLKAMLILAPKMSQRTLSGPLLKHLSKLQVDEEAAIRTNTTILLGNIARHLNDATRKRVLINAFTVRALRDTFPPARAAGIMALMATKEYYDAGEIATRILPMLVILTVDADPEVREKATQASMAFLQAVASSFASAHDQALDSSRMATAPSQSSSILGWAVSSLTTSSAPAGGAGIPPSKSMSAGDLSALAHTAPGAQDGMGQPSGGFTPPNPAAAPAFGAKGSGSSDFGWDAPEEQPALSPSSGFGHSSFSSTSNSHSHSRATAEEEPEVEAKDEEGDGWGDIDDAESEPPAALSRIQAAQRRPVVAAQAPSAASSTTRQTSLGGVSGSRPSVPSAARPSASSAAKPSSIGGVSKAPAASSQRPAARVSGTAQASAPVKNRTGPSGHVALPTATKDLSLDSILGDMETPVPKNKPSKLGAQRIVR